LERFAAWLAAYGADSPDMHDFWAWTPGLRAKRVYYRSRWLGLPLVAPFIALDAVWPASRALLRDPKRYPIALAQYADGFLRWSTLTQGTAVVSRGVEFLAMLLDEECGTSRGMAWGYPFDWETCFGTFPSGTPLITTMPYAYDALSSAYRVTGDTRWAEGMRGIAAACAELFPQTVTESGAHATAYTPSDRRRVVNASAYRAHVLADAGAAFDEPEWTEESRLNVRFVLESQRDDGSWPYAVDGMDDFTDNFHTCFVLKCLHRASSRLQDGAIDAAVARGYAYYQEQLLDADGLPLPFSREQRPTLYRRDLYDYAEGLNLAVLLRGVDERAWPTAERLAGALVGRWQLDDGHFVTRETVLGRNTVPYHRWAQAPAFRALVCYLEELQA
jgi:hypothetical protein